MKLRNSIKEQIGDRKLLTTGEAAELIGVDRQTIANYINKGVLPYKEVGGWKYINADTLLALSDTLEEVEKCRRKAVCLKEQISETVTKRKKILEQSRAANTLYGKLNDSEFSGIIAHHILSMGKSVLSEGEYTVLRYLLVEVKDINKIKTDHTPAILRIAPNHINRIINVVRNKIHVAKDYATLEEENKKLKHNIDLVYEVYKRLPKDAQIAFTNNNLLPTHAGIIALDTLLEDYNVDARIINYLYPYGIRKISDLVQCPREKIHRIRNIGKKCMSNLNDLLEELGLEWGMDVDAYRRAYVIMNMGKENDSNK